MPTATLTATPDTDAAPAATADPETSPTMGSPCPNCRSNNTWGTLKPGGKTADRGCNDCGATWSEQM